MADFFSGLAEGYQAGNQMSLQQRQQKAAEDHQAFTQKMQAKQMELQLRDQDIQTTGVLFKAMDANIPAAARQFLLTGLAQQMGVDPKSEYFKGFSKVISTMESDQLTGLSEGFKGLLPDANPGEVSSLVKSVISGKVPFAKAIELFTEGKKRAAARAAFGEGGAMAPPTAAPPTGEPPAGTPPGQAGPTKVAAAEVQQGATPVEALSHGLPDAKELKVGQAVQPPAERSAADWRVIAAKLMIDDPENGKLALAMANSVAASDRAKNTKAAEPVVKVQLQPGQPGYDPKSKTKNIAYMPQSKAAGMVPAPSDTPETLHPTVPVEGDAGFDPARPGRVVYQPTSVAGGMGAPAVVKPYADPTDVELAKSDVKIYEPLMQKGQQAFETKRNTAIIKGALDSNTFETGTFSGLALGIGKVAQVFGLDPEKDLGINLGRPATAEAISSAAKALAVKSADSLSKSTNLSLDLLTTSIPELVKTVEGNRFIVDAMNAGADTDIAIASKITENRAKYGKDYAFPPGQPALWEDVKRMESDRADPAIWKARLDSAVNKGKEIDLTKLAGGAKNLPPIIVGKGPKAKSYSNLGQDDANHDLIEVPRPSDGKLTKMPVIWDFANAKETLATGDMYVYGGDGQIYHMTVPGKKGVNK